MNLKVIIKGETSDGIVIEREANSFVQAFIFILCVQTRQADLVNQTKDSNGTLRTLRLNAINFANNDMQVGTGTNSVTISDNAMQTAIGNGNGAGQLLYGAVSISDAQTTATQAYFTISRTFQNNSGNDITIKEVGLFASASDNVPVTRAFLIDRTLFTLPVVNGLTATITYTIMVTV